MLDKTVSDFDLRQAYDLQSIAEQAASVGCWSLDIASGREYCSPGLYRLLELDPENVPAGVVAWQSVLNAVDADAATILIKQSIEGHRPFRATHRIVLSNSGIRWIEVHGQASYDTSGNPLRFSGYCIDVTDRGKAEQDYREIKERQGFLLQLGDALAPLSDPTRIQVEACRVLGQYLEVNRVFYAEAEENGLNRAGPQYLDGVPPTDEVWHSNDFDPSLLPRYQSGEVLTCDDVTQSSTLSDAQKAAYATDQIVAWAAAPIAKPGMPLGRLVIHQNRPRHWDQFEIDLIKETAERVWPAVQRAKSQVALELTENIPVGTYKMVLAPGSSAARFSFLSKRFLEISGLNAEEVHGDPLKAFDCVHPDDYHAWIEKNAETLAKRVPFLGETRIIVRGETRWVRAESAPRNMADGSTVWEGVLIDITDQRQAEEALRESEDRYRMVAEITEEAWWEEDLQAHLLTNSPRFCEILNRGEEILHCTAAAYRTLIHPDDRAHSFAAYSRAIHENADYRVVYRLRHADGHYVWVEDHARVIGRDAQGAPTRMLGAITDITARKEAEIALKESEKRYRLVADITKENWWEEDLETGRSRNSRRIGEILGAGNEMLDCSSAVYDQRIHPDDRARVQAAFDRAIHGGTDYEEVYRLRHADGHYVWVEDHGRIVAHDAKGRPTRMLGAITDITARKEAEIALKESEANFRHLFDEAPDAYLLVDPADGRILACNYAAERMLAGSAGQIIGMTPDEVSPVLQPDGRSSREGAAEQMRKILDNGYHRFEWVHRRFDGTEFWAEVTVTLGRFQHREVLYTIWREIGEIIAAKQAAEAASIAKSQFLSVMSHELRTPLTAIMGMFQLIDMAGAGDKVRQFAAKGLNSSEHLLELVNDILDFSSIEAGRLAVVSAPFQLRTLLDAAGQMTQARRKPGVDLKVSLDDALQTIELMGDTLRLKQVLINLLGNALKFTEQGSVVLSVRHVGGTKDMPLLEYAVTDTGIGLTPDQQSRLFQPFTQVDMSSVRRFGGTGLGLVISQRLVSLLGGEPIAVESQQGAGSRFSFRLALPVVEGTPAPRAGPAPALEALSAGRLAGYRLLVVEDGETTRFMLRLLLEAEGAAVEEAEDGAKGVSAALGSTAPFDAVLMDMRMPGYDGLEATRELRARGYVRPILALTANAYGRDRNACLAAGMNDYVTKPVRIDDLVEALQRNCRG